MTGDDRDAARGEPPDAAREALATMRRYAQEMQDEVLWKHVELYVNDATLDLGAAGTRALAELARLARASGFLPPGVPPLEVFGGRPAQAP